LQHYDAVVAMRERTAFPRSVLERLPHLKLLVTTGHRNAAIDIAAAKECGITVSGTGGYLHSTIELTWGLIIGLLRNFPEELMSIRAGGWQHTMGYDLHGATLGVVGLGNMGSHVAAIGRAFGMRTIAWSTNMTPEAADAAGCEYVSKEDLFAQSDVLTIHLQLLGDRNRGVVGREDIARMKPDAFLVNTSRGPIVDETALVQALAERRIAGAAIDVYDLEPMSRHHPFRSLSNVLATPHIGYVTRNTYRIFLEEAAQDVAAWLNGSPIRIIEHD
jgi:phosphoglycerate dehydrogenase-like enzyme